MDEDSCADVGIGAAGIIMAASRSHVNSLIHQPASHSPLKAGPLQEPTTESQVLDGDYLERRNDRAGARCLAPSRRPRRPVRGLFRGTPGISFLGFSKSVTLKIGDWMKGDLRGQRFPQEYDLDRH